MLLLSPQEIENKFDIENIVSLPGDASSRMYFRAKNKFGKSVIVMLYPNADVDNYSEIKRFCDINKKLENHGVRVAKIYKNNEQMAAILLEDLGVKSFGNCLRDNSEKPHILYAMATRNLMEIKEISDATSLPLYTQTRTYENRRHLIDYYMTLKKGNRVDELCVVEFHDVWKEIEQNLPPCPQGFVHGDYHLENLIYTNEKQCAVIDHQDAFYGPLPYDLVNLLEDARISVPQDIRSKMIDMYTKNMSEDEKQIFMIWYKVLCAQFHGRVLGLFIKFAVDRKNDSYLIHIPRLQNYLLNSLKDPVLTPLKSWFDAVKLDFEPLIPLDGDHIRAIFDNSSA